MGRRGPVIVLSILYFVGLILFWFSHDFFTIALVTVLVAAVGSPLVPLKESLTMAWVTARGYDYGRIRLWGSLSFIVVSMSAGFIITPFGPEAILYALFVLSAFSIASGFALPPDPRKGEGANRPKISFRSILVLATDMRYLLFVLAASAAMSSHAVYYAFGTLNWQSLGYSDGFIGGLWALGVVAEIGLFAFSGTILRRISPPVLILIGAGAATVRWTGTAFDPHWSILIVLQCLHALTFGATHLGVMQYIARAVPPQLAATALGIYGAISGGIIMALLSLASGPAYQAWGAHSYLAMAAMGALGVAFSLALLKVWRKAQI